MRETTVELADERVDWKVPTLFDNDWIALSLANALNPLLSKSLFSTAYGCPACAWAGGRPLRQQHRLDEQELRRYFEAYRSVGSCCALTFSRPDAGDFLDDAYSNLLLSLVDEYDGQAIVVDDRLAQHIRTTHPSVTIVASNNICVLDHAKGFGGLDEEKYYRHLLERYDEVVVRCEALLPGGIAERLVDVADRIELIVNQRCVVNCPDAPAHIAAMAHVIKTMAEGGDPGPHSCTQVGNKRKGGNIYVSPERRTVLADRGFVKFKLQGRNAPATLTLKNLVHNICRDRDAVLDLDALYPIMEEALVMDVSRITQEELKRVPYDGLTRIPESLSL